MGISASRSTNGKPLRDGAAALVIDGTVIAAVAEERLSRVKHDGGWNRSASAVLLDGSIAPNEVDIVAVSSCCDSVDDPLADARALHARFPRASIERIGHHHSHATLAYVASGWDTALVVVSDAGGNTLEPAGANDWWTVAREQSTYWLGQPTALELVASDFDRSFEMGIGELFRAATYYLGWPSQVFANKTMALAALGDVETLHDLGPLLAVCNDGHIRSPLRNNPLHPTEALGAFGAGELAARVAPRVGSAPITPGHAALAALVQRAYEDALLARLRYLLPAHKLDRVCLSGGVAYNCKANGLVSKEWPCFVPAAPGDTGQALGNALAATWRHGGLAAIDRAAAASAYLGPLPRRGDDVSLPPTIARVHVDDPAREVAERVLAGNVVGLMAGRAEIGARALGHRSIFADPRQTSVKDVLNRAKRREPFNPFGASILASDAPKLLAWDAWSPYMQHAIPVTRVGQTALAAASHLDGTCRAQTVPADGTQLARILELVKEATGYGALLNTSLNGHGEPIAQDPAHALPAVQTGVIDSLFVGHCLFERSGGGSE